MQPQAHLHLPKVIGHRGLCKFAPENTLASLYKAHAMGLQWVEFDVALTKDGEAVVIHDEKLKRTTNGKGLVANLTYAEIAQLDAGSWFDKSFGGERVPTFIEYLKTAAALGLSINVEIKPTAGQDIPTAYKVVETLQQHWPAFPQKLLLSSFSWTSLAVARALDESVPLSLLLKKWQKGWEIALKQLNCVALGAKSRILTARKVSALKANGLYVLSYTVNEPKIAKKLYAWGVDSVFSDGGILPSTLDLGQLD